MSETTQVSEETEETKKPRKRNFLCAPPAKPRLSQAEVEHKYPRLRRQVFLGIFFGYAAFYLIRNNISLVGPLLRMLWGTTKWRWGSSPTPC